VAADLTRRGGHAGEAEQVVLLVGGAPQRAGEGGHHLLGGVGAACLFQPGVEIARQPGQHGDLLAPQARRPAAHRFRQAHFRRRELFAPPAQEFGVTGPIDHGSSMRA
jgi:hypothetical protein